MKKMILVLGLLAYQSSFATWTEKVTCKIERTSVDDLSFSRDSFSGILKMSSMADVATGKILIQSDMIPSYQVELKKESDGRSERLILTTMVGKNMLAKSTVIATENAEISNQFINIGNTYEFKIICKTQ